MAKITVYLKDPEEEVTIESTPPKTFLRSKYDKESLLVFVYQVDRQGRSFWTGNEIKKITYHRKDVFPLSRIIRTKTEGELED